MKEPIDPVVLSEARTYIGRLEMVSNGATKNWESDGRGGDSEAVGPTSGHQRAPDGPEPGREVGDGAPEFVVYRHRLERAVASRDGAKVREVRDAAKADLELARRGAKKPKLMHGTLAWKQDIAVRVDAAKSKAAVGEICRVEGISRATAYNYRRDFLKIDVDAA